MDKKRIPPTSELHLLLQGADLAEAKQELDNAANGDECHDKVAEYLRCDLDDLPDAVPENIEPNWLRELLFCIMAHRKNQGV